MGLLLRIIRHENRNEAGTLFLSLRAMTMRSTKTADTLYRLDYYGDEVPGWMSDEDVRLLLWNNYGTEATIEPLLVALRWGCAIHVRNGTIRMAAA
jgi:hypothetical protein